MLWSQFCNSIIKLYFARHKHIYSTRLNRTGDQTSDCSICWLTKKQCPWPFLLLSPMYECLFICTCVCEREIWPIWTILSHYVSTNQNRESVCLMSCMSVYDDDDDLLISDAQQRVIDQLVPPSLLLSISAHSSLSVYKSLISSFSAWIPVNYN